MRSRSAIGLLLLITACAGRSKSSEPVISEPQHATAPVASKAPPIRTGVTGHVTLDGKPVRYFGVTVTRNFTFSGIYGRPAPMNTRDGRFTMAIPDSGTWDLIVAGPGFARRVLPGVEVEDGRVTDLGEVAVSRGHRIEGTVQDEAGHRVSGATVSLAATPPIEVDDELAALAKGNITATTDSDGHYLIEGAAAIPLGIGHPQIAAMTADHRASIPELVPEGDATINFTVARSGGIEVTVVGVADSFISVSPVGKPKAIVEGRRVTSGYVFDDVPAGDYEVHLIVPIKMSWSQRQHVSVTAGSVVAITMTTPTMSPVAVVIHVKGGPCDSVRLELPGADARFASETCRGADAQFGAVLPGHYFVCAESGSNRAQRCAAISVDEAPASQQFDVPRQ
jgi:hypothetical protein